MTTITSAQLDAIAGGHAKNSIVQAIPPLLDKYAPQFVLDRPHRLAHFLAQVAHESAHFRTTREYHDGSNYEGRRDLGNTRPGDGKRFRGRGLIQTTGRYNTEQFTHWAQKNFRGAPDFVATPERLEEFPWAFLSAVYYWDSRNLNTLADRNDAKQITKMINGGFNGLPDRLEKLGRAELVLAGYGTRDAEVRRAQGDLGVPVDGRMGPTTRAALFKKLKGTRGAGAAVVGGAGAIAAGGAAAAYHEGGPVVLIALVVAIAVAAGVAYLLIRRKRGEKGD